MCCCTAVPAVVVVLASCCCRPSSHSSRIAVRVQTQGIKGVKLVTHNVDIPKPESWLTVSTEVDRAWLSFFSDGGRSLYSYCCAAGGDVLLAVELRVSASRETASSPHAPPRSGGACLLSVTALQEATAGHILSSLLRNRK